LKQRKVYHIVWEKTRTNQDS